MRCDYVWLTVLDHCQASCGVFLSLNYHEHASNDFHGYSMIKLLCPLFARSDFGLLIFFTRPTVGWPPPLQVLTLILPPMQVLSLTFQVLHWSCKLPMSPNVCWSNILCQACSPNYHANNEGRFVEKSATLMALSVVEVRIHLMSPQAAHTFDSKIADF